MPAIEHWKKDLLASLFLVFLALLLRSPSFEQPVERDIGAYATIGLQMQQGALPYKDLVDNKQPLIYMVFWLIELLAPQSNEWIQITAALVSALAGILVYLFLRRRLGTANALYAAIIFSVLSAQNFQGINLNTEHLLVPILCVAICFPIVFDDENATNWTPYLAGLFGGLAILTKAIAVFALCGALLFLLLKRKRILETSIFYCLGVASPLFAVVAIYAKSGGLKDLYYWNIVYNRLYISSGTYNWLHYVSLPAFCGELFVLALSVASLKLELCRGREPVIWAGVVWLIGATLGAELGGRQYPHYFAPIIAPAVVLIALPCEFRGTKIRPLVPLFLLTLLSIPSCVRILQTFSLTPNEIAFQMYGAQANVWEQQQAAGAWLREHAHPNDTLYVAGNEPSFYWTSGLRPATKFIYVSPTRLDASLGRELIEDLRLTPPDWVVLPPDATKSFQAAIPMKSLEEKAVFGAVQIYSHVAP